MASGINSSRRKRLQLELAPPGVLVAKLAERIAQEVPILVIRLPDLEATAWKRGRTAARRLERRAALAFRKAANRVLRAADVLGHAEQSELFLIALLDPAREKSTVPSPTDCRNALRRITVALHDATGLRVENGWTIIRSLEGDRDLAQVVAEALERGARERERYDFFSAVGHELRTPLTSIRGYLETLLDEDLEPESARRFLEVAHAESLRLARLLDGMFEISLLDARAMGANDEASDVASGIRSAVEIVLPAARARGVTVYVRASAALAQVGADHLIQMIVNLVDNAIKHGRERGTVVISSEVEDGEFIGIAIDDDGPGVVPQERERIFAFSERGSTSAEGTGIGLAFVRMMAERIGGDVSVSGSRLGGARFVLRLPLADAVRSRCVPRKSAKREPPSGDGGSSRAGDSR